MERAKYLFSRSVFKRNVDRLREAFANEGIDVTLGYSVKTNNSEIVLAEAKRNGMLAEVVSTDEFRLATTNIFAPSDVIFNGVIPDPETKFAVASMRGIVNVDSFEELKAIAKIAIAKRFKISLSIRINVDMLNKTVSRFGVPYPSHEFDECMDFAKQNSKYIEINGIHSHVHGCRDIKYWEYRTGVLAAIAKQYNMSIVDFGSGLYGPMEEKFAKNFPKRFTFEQYAKVIADIWKRTFEDAETRPRIILEPGTPVVANAVDVMCEVVSIKEAFGKTFAVTNTTLYDFGFLWIPIDIIKHDDGSKEWVHKQFAFDVYASEEGKEYTDVDIVGYTCVEGDVLYTGYSGKLGVGDKLIFRNAGAYTYSMRNCFIKYPLELVAID